MRTSTFFEQLPDLFTGEPADGVPADPRWEKLAGEITGFTSPAELAVLNLAAQLLPPDECYLEVGTFKGRSLCGAVQGVAATSTFFAMENFLEFGMAGQQARDELKANLAQYAGAADVQLLEGDCFRLMADRGLLDRPVGVYFYDGEHTVLAHYLALAVVEPLLADEALVLVDDATWPVVQRAHRLFLASHPGWTVSATWDARTADDPRWANGLHALTFVRRPAAPAAMRRRDEALRRYQIGVQHRLNAAAWKAAGVMPGVVKAGARLVLSRSREI